MISYQNPYEQILNFVAQAVILNSIFLVIIFTTKGLKIAYELIEGSKGQKIEYSCYNFLSVFIKRNCWWTNDGHQSKSGTFSFMAYTGFPFVCWVICSIGCRIFSNASNYCLCWSRCCLIPFCSYDA